MHISIRKEYVSILWVIFTYIAIVLINTELAYSIIFGAILSQSLNIALGFAGLVNLGVAAFLGIGAYVFATLVTLGINPYLSMIAGGCVSAIVASLIGAVVLRLRGPYFAICTLSLSFAVKYFIIGGGIAGGPYGMILYKYIDYNVYVILCILLVLSVILTILTLMLKNSPLGYSLRALREDHDAAQTSGVDAFKCKLIAFVVSSFFPGILGGIMGFKLHWVYPDGVFNVFLALEALLTLFLGGLESVTGPIIGALIYEILKDFLIRYFPGFQVLIFGISLITIVNFVPGGIIALLRHRSKKLQKIFI